VEERVPDVEKHGVDRPAAEHALTPPIAHVHAERLDAGNDAVGLKVTGGQA